MARHGRRHQSFVHAYSRTVLLDPISFDLDTGIWLVDSGQPAPFLACLYRAGIAGHSHLRKGVGLAGWADPRAAFIGAGHPVFRPALRAGSRAISEGGNSARSILDPDYNGCHSDRRLSDVGNLQPIVRPSPSAVAVWPTLAESRNGPRSAAACFRRRVLFRVDRGNLVDLAAASSGRNRRA